MIFSTGAEVQHAELLAVESPQFRNAERGKNRLARNTAAADVDFDAQIGRGHCQGIKLHGVRHGRLIGDPITFVWFKSTSKVIPLEGHRSAAAGRNIHLKADRLDHSTQECLEKLMGQRGGHHFQSTSIVSHPDRALAQLFPEQLIQFPTDIRQEETVVGLELLGAGDCGHDVGVWGIDEVNKSTWVQL